MEGDAAFEYLAHRAGIRLNDPEIVRMFGSRVPHNDWPSRVSVSRIPKRSRNWHAPPRDSKGMSCESKNPFLMTTRVLYLKL
jgi:hypothetical protein